MQNFGGQIRCIMGVSNWRMDNYNEYEKNQNQNIMQTTANVYLT